MIEYQKEAILISFLNEKARYKRLAEYIVHLIRDDPSSPKESLHAIIYRIKDELRIIEKIDVLNDELEDGVPSISEENYQAKIGDILGVRIICLRLSDVEKVGTYLNFLYEEKILDFLHGPDRKRSFILPVNPDDSIPDEIGMRNSGYSSIHYQMQLGKNLDAPKGLKGLLFELQLRTILEEAWGEIDHKYRYVHSRIGSNIPEHIHTGFYNLSAYLQVAALQAEYLCRMAETHSLKGIANAKEVDPLCNEFSSGAKESDEGCKELPSEIEKKLEKILKLKVSSRTLIYIEKRLGEINSAEKPHQTLQKLVNKNRLLEFRTIFQEIFDVEPFANKKKRNIDAINALNYGIFYKLQGKTVAKEGLRAILKWRKDHSIC